VLAAAGPVACAGPRAGWPAVGADASRAFEEVRLLEREGRSQAPEARARAARAAERALALEPGWIAPRRFLDDLERADLLGPELLARHRQAIESAPRDSSEHYLLGRLLGDRGRSRMARAASLDPRNAWAWHGQAVLARAAGERGGALAAARRALELARDPAERAVFAHSLAGILLAEERAGEAIELLDGERARLASRSGEGIEADGLAVSQALAELRSPEPEARARGARRARELVALGRATAAECGSLLALAQGQAPDAGEGVRTALLQRAARDPALPAELLAGALPEALALALAPELAGGSTGARAWARGDVPATVEAWRASLPAVVLDEQGLPRSAELARLVRAARALAGNEGAVGALAELGEALIEAGWFAEARALAERLAPAEPRAGLALYARAQARLTALRQVGELVAAVGRGRGRRPPALELDAPERPVRDLDDLLGALADPLEPLVDELGPPGDGSLGERLRASPRLSYGIAGEVVHPGPTFSALDQRQGLGQEGQPVGGLAWVLARLGRFGILGDGLGTPPDATFLRRLWVERRSGEHLGVPFEGTVAWCEGSDFGGLATRSGAEIAGAALHEGYWVDLAPLREELERWNRLAERFSGADGPARVARALGVRPLACARGARAVPGEWLGEGDRVRLAVMTDRGRGANGGLAPITLDELCQVTAAHEEGHLCDRTRFYPVAQRWRAVLAFLLANRFSPALVARRLEERAQLVALCVASDPRVPLADVLDGAEAGEGGITPHGAAYAALARDLLVELDARLEREPERWPALERAARLAHQVHRLAPEEVRELALALARGRGLVSPGARADRAEPGAARPLGRAQRARAEASSASAAASSRSRPASSWSPMWPMRNVRPLSSP